jgi:hypothetical protein
MIDLLGLLSKFHAAKDHESEVALFRTHVPWVAPLAYLNIIYKPAASEVLSDVAAKLQVPASFVALLARYNGAILFSGGLSLYGVVRKDQLLDRTDSFSRLPFNIETENRGRFPDRDRFLKIGGYGFDGSHTCIDRRDSRIDVFHRGDKEPYCSWATLDGWLDSEIRRFSDLFDESGKPLVAESDMLPRQG